MISVVIVSYNSARTLAACLAAVNALPEPERRELIVVDNASADDSAAIAAQAGARLVQHGANLGFAGGVNAGVAAARGELIALLNPDAQPETGWLRALAAALADPAVGVAGSVVLGADGAVQSAGTRLVLPVLLSEHVTTTEIHPQITQITQILPATAYDVQAVHGAAMGFRRAVWQELGGFDAGFFPAYWEEIDFCERARRAGYRVVIVAGARVRHPEEASSTGKYGPAFYAFYHRNRLRYAAKWLPWDTLWEGFRLAEHARLLDAPPLDQQIALAVYRAGVPPLEALDDAGRAAALALAAAPPTDPLDGWLAELEREAVHRETEFTGRFAPLRAAWNGVSARWYVRPNLDQQTRFNLAAQRALRTIAERAAAQAAADALEIALLRWRVGITATQRPDGHQDPQRPLV